MCAIGINQCRQIQVLNLLFILLRLNFQLTFDLFPFSFFHSPLPLLFSLSMSLARRSAASSSVAARPEWVGVGADNSASIMDRGNQSMLRLSATAGQHVDAYIEYDRIVGDADGGKMFSEEEYAEFKANAIANRANRIYVSWRCMKT